MNYLAKVSVKLNKKTLNDMNNELNKKFVNLSKSFGRGLKNAVNFGMKGLTALATGNLALGGLSALVGALLNPFNEATETLNSVLSKADNIDTRATQLGTTSANYLKLQGAAQVKGVDQASFDMGVTRFQSALGKARIAKLMGEEHFLSDFTDYTDTLEAFYAVIQSLQNVGKAGNKDEMINLSSQIFGERVVGKFAEFLSADNLKDIMTGLTEGFTDNEINKLTQKGGQLQEQQALLSTRLENKNYFERLKLLDENKIRQQADYNEIVEAQKTKNLENYDNTIKLAKTYEKVKAELQKLSIAISEKLAPTMERIFNWMEKTSFFDLPTKEGINKALASLESIDATIAKDIGKKLGANGNILDAIDEISKSVKAIKDIAGKTTGIANFINSASSFPKGK